VEAVPPRVPDEDIHPEPSDPFEPLRVAFDRGTAEDRWRQSRRLGYDYPSLAALHLAHASACMELLRSTRRTLPRNRHCSWRRDWEAAHFELGKLWVRSDDTERAAAGVRRGGAPRCRASRRRSATWARRSASSTATTRRSTALKQALRFDPYGHTILNNIGAVARDLGRLDEAETAFRQALTHARRSSSLPTTTWAHAASCRTLCRGARRLRSGAGAPTRSRVRGSDARAALGPRGVGRPSRRAASYFEQALEERDADGREELVTRERRRAGGALADAGRRHARPDSLDRAVGGKSSSYSS
jgi:hypothetical protein